VAFLGTVLGIWAHPDDESYLSAGLMARATFNGSRVVVAMATKGEAGSPDPERWPPEEIAKIREQELVGALDAVGVVELMWLGYADGGCRGADFEEAVGKLTGIIEAVQPDTVLTFPPDGLTGHLDHQAVSTWATEAFQRAAKRGAKLYYATVTPELLAEMPTEVQAVVFEPGWPKPTPREFLAIDFEVPDDLMKQKRRAIRSHASQVTKFFEAYGEDLLLNFNHAELFKLALEQREPAP
jgi:LmbE family N-acetylglucosaminyl deacetylase